MDPDHQILYASGYMPRRGGVKRSAALRNDLQAPVGTPEKEPGTAPPPLRHSNIHAILAGISILLLS
jgi:hypothetical protein